MTIAFIAARLF